MAEPHIRPVPEITWRHPRAMRCPYCDARLVIPPTGDREDAMRPHLPDCRPAEDE